MKSQNKFIISSLLLLSLSFSGCENFLEEKDLPRLTPDFYATPQGVESAATATYSYMRWGAGEERFNALTEYGTDLFTQGEDPGPWAAAFNQYGSQLNPDADVLYGLWENHYKAINTANLVIQQVQMSEQMTASQQKAAIAEMSFLRAYFYFDLVQQFGSIPLVTEVSFEIRTDFKRNSIAEIYQQIINDLIYASQNLPENPVAIGRASSYSAAHLLAKVYLTRGSAVQDQRGQQPTDIDSALTYSEKVLNSGKYMLLPNFASLWDISNQGNKEVVFSVQFTTNLVYNGSGNAFHLFWGSWYEDQPGMQRDLLNGRPYRRHRPTNRTMLELFDRKNDSRFYKSFKWAFLANRAGAPIPVGDTAIYYSMKPAIRPTPYRYFQWNEANPQENNRYYPVLIKFLDPQRASVNEMKGTREWVRMRLAETYLIAAEAAGRKGDWTKAAQYINVIRRRAAWQDGETKSPQYQNEEGGQPNDVQSTYEVLQVREADLQKNFIDFVLTERGRELLGETSRWEDLVRCEKLAEYVSKYNPDAVNFREYHKLRPIPQRHIDRINPKGSNEEEQNPGY